MTASTPTVSVVIPTYNAEADLQTCIDSILNQSFEGFEIVVVDDGSTDDTLQILKGYEDDRIRIIERENETGITSAINRGVEESRGHYIARHDADDYSSPERFERQVEYLDNHEDVALLGTGAWLVNNNRGRLIQRRVLERPSVDDLINHNHYVHGSVMMRADALESVKAYDEDLFATTEDYDLWLRLAAKFPVRNLDEPLYNFRIHDDSIYGSQLREVKLYHFLAIMRARGDLSESLAEEIRDNGVDGLYDNLPKDLRQEFHAEMGQELIRYGHFKEGRNHCLKALRFSRYTAVMAWLMLFLSFSGEKTAQMAGSLYRRFIVNPGIKSANKTNPA